MVNRKLLWMAFGVAVAFAMVPLAGASSNVDKTMYLTFSQPVRLPGVALGSGTYIFELANGDTGGDVVRVMSRNRSISYLMGFTLPVARPHTLSRGQAVSVGESAAGVAPPITVWWTDNSTGREFFYPGTR